jgi:hypothetical protein
MRIPKLKDIIIELKYCITNERKMVRVVKGFVREYRGGGMMGDGPYGKKKGKTK